MAKKTTVEHASHYEHIEEMSAEFQGLFHEDLTDDDGVYRHWQLRVQLAIAQQLSMISQALKGRD